MNSILNGIAAFFRSLSCMSWLNLYIVLSIQIAFVFGSLWLFRKPLSKIASTKYILRFLCSYAVLYCLSRPAYWDLFDLRGLYERILGHEIEPLIRLYIPVRIPSQIAEVPSTNICDWLGLCTVVWLLVTFAYKGPRRREERFTRSLIHKKYHLECPAHVHEVLDGILEKDARWQYFAGSFSNGATLKLVWIRALRSPCTFDTDTSEPVIALDRIDYSDEELESIFRHELAHITLRHERMLRKLDMLCDFCWFNPVLQLMRNWIRQQVEIDSDDVALEGETITRKERVSYARLLVSLAEEKHLSGAALHISAGAKLIQQRVEGVLNPKERKLSLPVTVLLIVLALHLSLVIAPGESPESRFLEPESLLACLGNDYYRVVHGLDPHFSSSRTVYFEDGDWYFSVDKIKSTGGFRFRGAYEEAYTEADNQAAAQYVGQWVADISDILGEPVCSGDIASFPGEFTVSYSWTATFSDQVSERIWGDSCAGTPAGISLTWKCVYLEDGSTNAFTGEHLAPHCWHEIYFGIGQDV